MIDKVASQSVMHTPLQRLKVKGTSVSKETWYMKWQKLHMCVFQDVIRNNFVLNSQSVMAGREELIVRKLCVIGHFKTPIKIT